MVIFTGMRRCLSPAPDPQGEHQFDIVRRWRGVVIAGSSSTASPTRRARTLPGRRACRSSRSRFGTSRRSPVCQSPAVTLAEVLATWRVVPDRVRLIQDRGSAHWSVRSAGERFVLRRYGQHRNLTHVLWEHDLLTLVSGRGWPVACAIGPPQVRRRPLYSLFPFIGGSRMRGGDDDQRRRCGRMLAEFHVDVAAVTIEPRPGAPKIWQFRSEAIVENTDALARRVRSPRCGTVRRACRGGGPRLRTVRGPGLPAAVVHCDFAPWNLRFTAGRLSALYDFDAADVDARAADVACATARLPRRVRRRLPRGVAADATKSSVRSGRSGKRTCCATSPA